MRHADRSSRLRESVRTLRAGGRGALMLPALLAGLAVASSLADDLIARGGTPAVAPTTTDSTTPTAAISTPSSKTATSAPVSDEIHQLLARLMHANEFLRETKHYAARFTQQVRKDDQLLDPEQIDVKVQHEPFAVFLQWERDGQQALFVEGAHDNKLLVHPTRGFGRLRRVWILEPDHRLAMRGALRPVTEIGMLNMVTLLLGFHREHLLASHCAVERSPAEDPQVTRFVLTFDSPRDNPYFAKTVLCLCNERHIPLQIENYAWSDDHQVGPLLERYVYSRICLDECVSAADFDRHNAAYSF